MTLKVIHLYCFHLVSKDDTYTTDLGPVRWEEEGSPSGISLDKNRSRIIVNSNGHYIVSVQAIFILENYTADERLRIELMANDKDALVVAWDEREVKEHLEEQTLRLSLLVLLELVKGQHISVKARHRDKFNYNTPISTFLTMIKYSNLQGVHNGTGPVYTWPQVTCSQGKGAPTAYGKSSSA